ncbi:MAG: membrane protein insertion efficiency factor YidD [Candidatus Marinimicrobia bacterium]|nr:membrane protein insertion efficiency factor YidD [Candidatus Neomarinimicrobiota bacterium]
MSFISSIVSIVLITGNLLNAQSRYPADTLLTSDSLSLVRKAGVLPIALWQRLSYNLPGLGCQFSPSCSNYGSQAISQHGLIAGSIVTADRIVRCNPFAWQYHQHMNGEFNPTDGRLIDQVVPTQAANNSAKSALLAASLSIILPGSGRAYAGRPWDGLMGFLMVTLLGTVAQSSYQNDHNIIGGIYLSATTVFYFGEIYGAWRTAKYYQPPKKP